MAPKFESFSRKPTFHIMLGKVLISTLFLLIPNVMVCIHIICPKNSLIYMLTFPRDYQTKCKTWQINCMALALKKLELLRVSPIFFIFLFICFIKIQVQLTMQEMEFLAKLKASNVTSNVYWHRWL